eukprot:4849530-Pleurochrysis_carterae.AAC.1
MEDDDDLEDDDDDDDDDDDGTVTDDHGSVTDDDIHAGISSVSSVPSGLATPDSLHLRKAAAGISTPGSGLDTPDSQSSQQLYQVLEQRDAKVGSAAFGSSHAYNIPTNKAAAKSAAAAGVSLALDPAELEKLDEATLKARYEEQRNAEREAAAPEDVSDIIEEQARRSH